ncbi:Clp protease ClpP [Eubacteriales bacterium OttesenSCG-928-A19]|nr:Clp protease ClpP [Eubacteriales bacterium OttesenSCG-928-A19]
MKKYYQVIGGESSADIYIYGDITSYPWDENDVSAAPLVREIDAMKVPTINVYINSYGGDLAEGLAITSALKRSSAKVVTHCDGFACSAASLVFMAGSERIMSTGSALFVHNALTFMYDYTNASELRKSADELDLLSSTGVAIYMDRISINEAELRGLMDAESWILPEDAVRMGFATGIAEEKLPAAASMSVRKLVMQRLMAPSPNETPCTPPAIDIEAVAHAVAERAVALFRDETEKMLHGPEGDAPLGIPSSFQPDQPTTTPKQFLMALLDNKEE